MLVSVYKNRKFTETSVKKVKRRTAGRTQWRQEREKKGPEKMQRRAEKRQRN